MNTNAPKPETATDHTDLLAAAAGAYESGKAIRKAAAKTARANRVKYREIATALGVSVNRAYTLVNEDQAEDSSAALEAAE